MTRHARASRMKALVSELGDLGASIELDNEGQILVYTNMVYVPGQSVLTDAWVPIEEIREAEEEG